MPTTFLPADPRSRIIDLMKSRHITQKQLAHVLQVHESTLSRFLSGKTEKLSEECVIRIARLFCVSTDFLLGTTEIPDQKNYDIYELGLSVEAARNLYTGKANSEVVSRLLENPRFAAVTYMIEQYINDTLAKGYAAQNQMLSSIGSMVLGQRSAAAMQAVRDIHALKTPAYQADQTTIQNTFMAAVNEIKRESDSDLAASKALSKEVTEQMFAELTKGQDTAQLQITPEQVADSVTGMIAGAEGVDQEALDRLNQALVGLMQGMVRPDASAADE